MKLKVLEKKQKFVFQLKNISFIDNMFTMYGFNYNRMVILPVMAGIIIHFTMSQHCDSHMVHVNSYNNDINIFENKTDFNINARVNRLVINDYIYSNTISIGFIINLDPGVWSTYYRSHFKFMNNKNTLEYRQGVFFSSIAVEHLNGTCELKSICVMATPLKFTQKYMNFTCCLMSSQSHDSFPGGENVNIGKYNYNSSNDILLKLPKTKIEFYNFLESTCNQTFTMLLYGEIEKILVRDEISEVILDEEKTSESSTKANANIVLMDKSQKSSLRGKIGLCIICVAIIVVIVIYMKFGRAK